jgi:hypothetical protein
MYSRRFQESRNLTGFSLGPILCGIPMRRMDIALAWNYGFFTLPCHEEDVTYQAGLGQDG